ncbi:hypothetical protein GWK08_09175 [Leptobacterium flavescens]|uniref:Nuclear transport factor 2 family protein n=1 Tax=Leptobacterium flavescens TaxID=472055 RepID=A0A6P0UKW2_9FLAO|nr:nuclear transport factor 2 family protein [Leptobacterium flavescens]NER13607.1 hypothetical protein [Leptobacterium flavescens]
MKNTLLLSFIFLLATTLSAQDKKADIEAVKAACYDYIDTFYKADTSLAHRSVHKSLRKTGFYMNKERGEYSKQLEMPFDKLIALAEKWNKDGSRADESSPREVEIFEVSDKTAIAKVTAVWGIDYMNLMKEDGKWMIVNVLWQSPPKYSAKDY